MSIRSFVSIFAFVLATVAISACAGSQTAPSGTGVCAQPNIDSSCSGNTKETYGPTEVVRLAPEEGTASSPVEARLEMFEIQHTSAGPRFTYLLKFVTEQSPNLAGGMAEIYFSDGASQGQQFSTAPLRVGQETYSPDNSSVPEGASPVSYGYPAQPFSHFYVRARLSYNGVGRTWMAGYVRVPAQP